MPNLPRQNDLKEEGFSVLEAMVAMAILAAGLLPILALQGQFVQTVTQIEHVEKSLTAQNNALNLMRTVDLTNVPTGCLLYTSPSPRDKRQSRMPSSA